MKDCAYCFNQRHLEGPEGEYAPCPACRTKPEPHRDPRAAMEAAVMVMRQYPRVTFELDDRDFQNPDLLHALAGDLDPNAMIEVEVSAHAYPAERATRDYPGSPAGIEDVEAWFAPSKLCVWRWLTPKAQKRIERDYLGYLEDRQATCPYDTLQEMRGER